MFQRVTPILEARFMLDGGAMFGIIPRPLWEKSNPPDARNRIEMAARCLLLRRDDGTHVLVDAGIGDKWGAKDIDIFHIRHPNGPLVELLRSLEVDPDSITDVVLSHLHFDHAGGLTRLDGDGTPQPVLPRARHHVQRAHWEWAQAPSVRDQGSFRGENFHFLRDAFADRLRLVDGETEILPGMRARVSNGHTPGMQLPSFDIHGRHVVFCADLLPTAGHLQIPWVMGYDCHPLVSADEKARLWPEAVDNEWILALVHDPEHPFITIGRDDRGRYQVRKAAARIEELL